MHIFKDLHLYVFAEKAVVAESVYFCVLLQVLSCYVCIYSSLLFHHQLDPVFDLLFNLSLKIVIRCRNTSSINVRPIFADLRWPVRDYLMSADTSV